MTDTNNKTNDFELDLDTPTTSEFMTYYSEKANMVYKYSDADSLLEHPESWLAWLIIIGKTKFRGCIR